MVVVLTLTRAAAYLHSCPARPLLLDCAHMYYNESEIGAALSHSLASGKLERKGLFVVTKIAHFNVGPHTACTYVTDPSVDAYVWCLACTAMPCVLL